MAQSQPEILPTGVSITPLAEPGTTLQFLNPGLPTLPDFRVDMAVTSVLSPDGNTLLILTSGFNQNLDATGNVDPNTSNEYVFVFDVTGPSPRQVQVIQIAANATCWALSPWDSMMDCSGPWTDVFTKVNKPWSYSPVVPDVLRTTQLPLPPATAANRLRQTRTVRAFSRPPRDASYWGEKMAGLDFSRSDHLDSARFNRLLWAGLKGEDTPYPTTRSGSDLRRNRQRLLAETIREQERRKAESSEASPEVKGRVEPSK